MRTSQVTWIVPSVLLCLIGAALLWVSTHSTGDLADTGVLVGATLTSLTLFPVSVAIDPLKKDDEKLRKTRNFVAEACGSRIHHPFREGTRRRL